jgi:hypothetical protein
MWYMPVVPAIQETIGRRIVVHNWLRPKYETLSEK